MPSTYSQMIWNENNVCMFVGRRGIRTAWINPQRILLSEKEPVPKVYILYDSICEHILNDKITEKEISCGQALGIWLHSGALGDADLMLRPRSARLHHWVAGKSRLDFSLLSFTGAPECECADSSK